MEAPLKEDFLEEARKETKARVEAREEEWEDDDWAGFVEEVVWWLASECCEKKRKVVATAVGLIVYGATTEEKLQRVADNKEEFKRQLSAKGISDAICDLLFAKYVAKDGTRTKRAGSGGSQGEAKRQKILDRTNPVGIGKLLGLLHETTVSGDVYVFASNVLDSSNKYLWVRDSYHALYDAVWQKAIQKKEMIGGQITYHPVVVTGTSGIGKSFFGIYALFRAVREKDITVVYTMYGEDKSVKRYVIAPPAAKLATFPKRDPRRLLLDLREGYPGMLAEDRINETEDEDAQMTQSMWWGQIKHHAESETFLERLLDGEATWAFVDLQKGVIEESTKRAIVLVSDDPNAYSSFVKHKVGFVLYMSIWTEQELKQALQKTKLVLGEEEVQERYSKVGGVPRSVFSLAWEQALDEVRRAIADLEPNSLGTTLVPGSNPRVTSRLVHQVSKPPFCNTAAEESAVTSVYASEYVRTAIYRRFLLEEKFKLRTWLQYTKGLVGGAERGPQFEWFAHVVLGKLKQDLPVKLTELLTKGGLPPQGGLAKHGPTEEKTLSPFATESVLYTALEEISYLQVGQYVQPLSGSEASIDAFCVSAGLPWEADSGTNSGKDPVLLLFQVTVARRHPVLGDPIKKIVDHVQRVPRIGFDPKKHEIYLVFIVEGLLSSAQAYLTKDKKKALDAKNLGDLKKIKQVCLQIE